MEVGLSSQINTTLSVIQRIAAQTEQNQLRISTGQNHQGTGDNPLAVSIAKDLSNRASDLLVIKDSINQGISKVETATFGLGFIESILNELKATSLQYEQAGSAADQVLASDRFNELKAQLDALSNDISFGGTNLISGSPDSLTVEFNENGSSGVTVAGVASDSAALGLDITDVATIDAAISDVRATAQSLGSQATVLSIREEFNDKLVNALEEGEAKLLEVDLNEAAAAALSLETRSQLSVSALKVAAQSERAILQLF
jgi:flagellin-like hook-associated protein FlgL